MPKVSIIVPIYNRLRYLPQALNSILKQTYRDFEIIVVDDGSTEDVQAFLAEFNFGPVLMRYFCQQNRGPGSARNTGIRKATGTYIAFLDSDDEWLPDYLSKMIAALEQNQCQWGNSAMCRVVLDENERELSRGVIPACPRMAGGDLYKRLLAGDLIGGPSRVIVGRKAFEAAGLFREDLLIREDWEMSLRLAKKGFRLEEIKETLHIYKIRTSGVTRGNQLRGLACTYRVLSDYRKEACALGPKYRQIYSEKFWDVARNVFYSSKRDYLLFSKAFIKSQLCQPGLARVVKAFLAANKNSTKNQ